MISTTMQKLRTKAQHGVRIWAALLAPILFCALGRAQQQTFLPDAPRPTTELANANFAGPFPFAIAIEPFTGSLAHPLCLASPELECSQEQAASTSTNLFVNSPVPHTMTTKQKAILARKDVVDPFNLLTIGGLSAISTAANAHSPYGPGVRGWARLSGVSLTEDMTHEFFGTFLIPSLVHQDPHYHRMPNASYERRIAHCLYQVVWTQSDSGKGMFNYATVLGGAVDEGISDAYVPYRRTQWTAASARYAVGLATEPIGNLITEFVPELASHVNVHVVFVQRVIDQIAREEGAGPQ